MIDMVNNPTIDIKIKRVPVVKDPADELMGWLRKRVEHHSKEIAATQERLFCHGSHTGPSTAKHYEDVIREHRAIIMELDHVGAEVMSLKKAHKEGHEKVLKQREKLSKEVCDLIDAKYRYKDTVKDLENERNTLLKSVLPLRKEESGLSGMIRTQRERTAALGEKVSRHMDQQSAYFDGNKQLENRRDSLKRQIVMAEKEVNTLKDEKMFHNADIEFLNRFLPHLRESWFQGRIGPVHPDCCCPHPRAYQGPEVLALPRGGGKTTDLKRCYP